MQAFTWLDVRTSMGTKDNMVEQEKSDEEKKEPYLRWHPASNHPTGTFRGDDLSELNRSTMDVIHESALAWNSIRDAGIK